MKSRSKSIGVTTYNTDIFDNTHYLLKTNASKHIIIPNLCSAMNKNVSGFSKELYKRYPAIMTNIDINDKPKNLYSHSIAYRHPSTRAQLIVANMYCQDNHLKNRHIHYGHLVFCMYEVKKLVGSLTNQFPDFSTEIHCSKFGVGTAGGNWLFISELIADIWNDIPVFVYQHSKRMTENAY